MASNFRALCREFNRPVAEKIMQRLDQIRAADTLEDLRHVPGNFHELTGDRNGEWACNLTGQMRLVFEPHNMPLPRLNNGSVDWSAIEGITVLEIIDYH